MGQSLPRSPRFGAREDGGPQYQQHVSQRRLSSQNPPEGMGIATGVKTAPLLTGCNNHPSLTFGAPSSIINPSAWVPAKCFSNCLGLTDFFPPLPSLHHQHFAGGVGPKAGLRLFHPSLPGKINATSGLKPSPHLGEIDRLQ